MFYVNVLTPDRVPEFFIPPKFTPQRKAGAALHRAGGEAARWEGPGGDGTDWDPRSRAALSMPHFPRARTPYGFCRLLESPHTRRKESLFHSQAEHQGLARGGGGGGGGRSASTPCPCPPAPGSPGSPPASTPGVVPLGLCRTMDSTTAPSPGVDPLGLCRTMDSTAAPFTPGVVPLGLCRTMDSTAAPFTPGVVPLGLCRTMDSTAAPSIPGVVPLGLCRTMDSTAAPFTPGVVPLGLCRTMDSTAALGARGRLRLRAGFCSQGQRVCLRLLSVEGLYEQFTDCRAIGCCLSLRLEPGKSQKQRSAVIRKSRNPVFNQDFYFSGITRDQLHSKLFKIKVMNKASRMKRSCVLGVCQLSLASILPL
ncbi:C2 calcium-dependent domain-containing protein 4A [Cetorhinus maximus]